MPDVGTISVRMGVSLADFQAGLKQATAVATSETGLMSAEMKRQSREGAESMRLIDEAIGVHISRPLTRIIGQTQTLGPLLAGAFQFSAVAAIGVVIAEQAKRLFEVTGAWEAWKDILGLSGETAEETAKRMESADERLIKGLHQKIELQDAYNQLVLGLKGGDFERAHIEMLKQETAEIQKQIALQIVQVQARANEPGWQQNKYLQGFLKSDPFLARIAEGFGISEAGGQMHSQIEANKMAESMKPLFEALKQIEVELQKDNWKIFRDDADEATKKAKEDIQELQGDLKAWNAAANDGWKTWMKINEELEKAAGVNFSTGKSTGPGTLGTAGRAFPSLGSVAPPPGAPQLADMAELQKVTDDQNESWKKAGEILEQIETPLQKYNAQLAILNELKPRLSTEQFTLAMQKLNEELAQADQRMQKLLKEGGAAGGFQAFLMQLKGEGTKGSTGQFTFDFLNKGLQGFEDETVKALTGAKTSWASFFESLDQMALKFFLNKLIQQLLGGGLSNLFGGGGGGLSAGAKAADTPGMFASGTDYAPGGMAWVGEQGPELLNLPRGSSVTPNSAFRGGNSITLNMPIDARGGEIGVEEKIARAISASAPQIIMRAVVESSEAQRRAPH